MNGTAEQIGRHRRNRPRYLIRRPAMIESPCAAMVGECGPIRWSDPQRSWPMNGRCSRLATRILVQIYISDCRAADGSVSQTVSDDTVRNVELPSRLKK